ncbi:transcription and mRNA export factor ENY2 isoform X3 [Vigna angularis]|uniref:transcription and mRNA export factor ENY2 isoform X3 n=1 Tax=Phaseolus angularis TaxID=3914 RepID=UPI0022B346F4|nr:transcription and mRNA export factor ENY2 isoform X3 [Vigna angularis]
MKLKASVNRPPTPDVVENAPEREPTLQELINIKLIETGEKERLMELLRERLVDCGWKDEMKALCRYASEYSLQTTFTHSGLSTPCKLPATTDVFLADTAIEDYGSDF